MFGDAPIQNLSHHLVQKQEVQTALTEERGILCEIERQQWFFLT